jgi:hypothetical protein
MRRDCFDVCGDLKNIENPLSISSGKRFFVSSNSGL